MPGIYRKLNIVKMFIALKLAPSFKVNPFKHDRSILKFILKNDMAKIDKSKERGLTLTNINIC